MALIESHGLLVQKNQQLKKQLQQQIQANAEMQRDLALLRMKIKRIKRVIYE